MDFELTEEQKSLVALVKDFGKREVEPKADYIRKLKETDQKNLRDRIPWDILKKAHDIGLRTLAVPAKYGGGGADLLTQVVIGEALGRYCGELGGMVNLITHLWGHCREFYAASEELQDEFFPQFMEDPTLMLAAALTEADSSSDVILPHDEGGAAVMTTFAYRDGDEWVINGEKVWCTGGGQADIIVVSARTDKNAPISECMGIFCVPTNTPGFSVVRANDMICNDLIRSCVVHFENVRIPARYLISKRRKVRAGVSFYIPPIIGTFINIYEKTKEYAKMRVQGGKPIFEHKNIGPLIVDMYIQIETLRYLVYKAAWEFDQATKSGTEAIVSPLAGIVAWAYCKEVGFKLIEHACEVYGANAVMKDMPLEPFIRETFLIFHGHSNRSLHLIRAMKLI